jgi:hypothetical protein
MPPTKISFAGGICIYRVVVIYAKRWRGCQYWKDWGVKGESELFAAPFSPFGQSIFILSHSGFPRANIHQQ